MNRRFYILLSMLVGVGALLGGCSSTGSSMLRYDSNNPQTFLAGADVEQAKSLAMGSAVTKGWNIVDSSGDKLVVRRPLNAAAAQSVTGEPVSTAAVEVKSSFFQRQEGVDVVVGATMIANEGSKSQRKIDFTDSYKDDLNRSLDSLQRAWSENRWRVASGTPPLPTNVAAAEDAGPESAATPADATQSAESGPAFATAEAVQTSAVAPPAEAAGGPAIAASTPDSGAAPVEDRYDAATPLPPIASTTATAPANPAANMMALNRQGEPGVWTYYAEHYAKIRGCEVSDTGAVLQEKTPEFEVHRVYCEDQKTFLVKCNAGSCRGLE